MLKFDFIFKNYFLILKDGQMPYDERRVISLPVYFSNNREKIVTKLDVPCDGDHNKWLQMGVAIIMRQI